MIFGSKTLHLNNLVVFRKTNLTLTTSPSSNFSFEHIYNNEGCYQKIKLSFYITSFRDFSINSTGTMNDLPQNIFLRFINLGYEETGVIV